METDMEKEVIYENTFEPEEVDINEYIAQNMVYKRSLLSGFVTWIVVMLGVVVWWQLSRIGFITHDIAHFVAFIILLFLIVISGRYIRQFQLKMAVKKFREKEGNLDYVRTLFYDDHLVTNGVSYDYNQMYNVQYGKSCLFLITRDDKIIFVKDSREAFNCSQEKYDQFWKFINEKVKLEKVKKQSAFSLFRK
jgi:hypothetical protein